MGVLSPPGLGALEPRGALQVSQDDCYGGGGGWSATPHSAFPPHPQLPGPVLSTLPGTRTVTHVTALIEDASAVWDEMLLQS